MDALEAHKLYMHLKTTDASAKQKRGLGFGGNASDSKDQATSSAAGLLTGFKRASSSPDRDDRKRYAEMTAAQQLKARTKFQLQQRDQDTKTPADGEQWTRFVFNQDALLEEEGAQPAQDLSDAEGPFAPKPSHLQRSDRSQAVHATSHTHEDAIFGAPSKPQAADQPVHSLQPAASKGEAGADVAGADAINPIVTANQSNLSWRERAAQMRERRMLDQVA
ncbi:hypothetical protein WJX73_000327 [Symbiochloris irregularis]|uniref:Uncharacterized protein n=1 Tax=Symbiochloris irregularis TaxID=706552 RepID=A0AAW1PR98_9CHLO